MNIIQSLTLKLAAKEPNVVGTENRFTFGADSH